MVKLVSQTIHLEIYGWSLTNCCSSWNYLPQYSSFIIIFFLGAVRGVWSNISIPRLISPLIRSPSTLRSENSREKLPQPSPKNYMPLLEVEIETSTRHLYLLFLPFELDQENWTHIERSRCSVMASDFILHGLNGFESRKLALLQIVKVMVSVCHLFEYVHSYRYINFH